MYQLNTFPFHPQIRADLQNLLLSPPSTLLFAGPKKVGKGLLAKAFAHALLSDANHHKLKSGNHPDLRELFPEGRAEMHSMQVIKNLSHETQLSPFEAARRVFIIYEAERMLPATSHALLKTLEEPPCYAHFILVSSQPQSLLTTIISRAFQITFSPLLPNEHLEEPRHFAKKKEDQTLRLIAELGTAAVHRNYSDFFRVLTKIEELVEVHHTTTIEEVLTAVYYWHRDVYLLQAGGDCSLIFFRKQQEELKKNLNCFLLDLNEIQKRMQQVQEALMCHISLKHCLMYLLI